MKKTQTPLENQKSQLSRAARMLRRIQPWLQSQHRKATTYADISSWTGIPEDTIRGWFAGSGNPTAELLLSLLERTSEKVRDGLVDEFCRAWPTLEHPRLSGDLTIISRLKTILSQTRGLTYVQGDNDERRTFLITSLGHAFLGFTPPPRRVVGVDAHAPDWFVPVPGVVYFRNVFQPAELRREAQRAWPQLHENESPLLIFNGIWSALPDFQPRIRQLASRCHVIIADGAAMQSDQLASLPTPANIITVGSGAPQPAGIIVVIRTL